MREISPFKIILLGGALVFAGFLLPFLMLLRVLEPGLALSFLSHSASLVGLLLAVSGSFLHLRSRRRRD